MSEGGSQSIREIFAPFAHPDDPGWTEMPDWADVEDRRRRQRAENIAIGEGTDVIPIATTYTLDEMLEKFVFIRDGSQVAPIDRPLGALALADFRNTMAASKHWFEKDGKKTSVPTVKCWLESPKRLEADSLTFRAGGEKLTANPFDGGRSLNLWAGYFRHDPPEDWQDRAQPFVEHIQWLWGEDAPKFLDWLAHIEQQPGIMPHYGWVHISRQHGKGRNWISSVLTRVWSGYVGASLDLAPILERKFNDGISRKILAIVDEINEGGNASYRHAQALKQVVTEEIRHVNPKYGRKRHEYNHCRWLIFSNHIGALPLTDEDRRFWVVSHDGTPKDGAYYSRLYGALADRDFIMSVAEFLRQRDIAHFRPGEHPPMNAAKAELVAFSQSEDDVILKEVAARWPVDLILSHELESLLGDGGAKRPAARHAMDRAGLRKLQKKIKFFEHGAQNVYAIRNFEQWASANAEQQRDHITSILPLEKTKCLETAE